MRSDEILAVLSPEVGRMFNDGTVYITGIDRDRLRELGWSPIRLPMAERSEIWHREVPGCFRFPHYLAVLVSEDDSGDGILYGIQDHLLSRLGWKGWQFSDFLYRVGFRDPEGNEDNPEAVRWIDHAIREAIGHGAFRTGGGDHD